jgi:MFS family permease
VQGLRQFSRNVRLLLAAVVLVALAWDGVRAVLFNLYLLRLGYGPDFVGVVTAVSALAFAIMCLPAGTMGARWGNRNMLIAGVSMLAVGFGSLLLAESLPGAWRTGWLLVSYMVTYLGFALYLVNGLPFMMGSTGPEERNYAFSVQMALSPLAAFAGSLVAGFLPGVFASLLGVSLEVSAPYRITLGLAVLLLIPSVLILLRTRSVETEPVQEPTGREPGAQASRAPYALIAFMALVMAFRFGGWGTTTAFYNVYLDDGLGVSTALIGAVSAVAQLLAVPAALAAPLLVATWSNSRVVAWGTLGTALCLLPLALIPFLPAAGLGFVGATVMFYVTTGPIRVFSQELVAPRWRTAMASVFMLGAGLAYSGMSLAGGYIVVAVGYRVLFLVASGMLATGAVLFWAYFRVPRGELARAPEVEAGE